MSKQEETVTFLGISNRTGDALSMTIALLLFLVSAILEVKLSFTNRQTRWFFHT